jgi:Flp pilus assembly protein TadG
MRSIEGPLGRRRRPHGQALVKRLSLSVFNTKPRSSNGRSRKRGQALVEFCLVIPIFLLMLCGIADFGVALFSRMSVINAARDGARASVMVTDHSTIGGTTCLVACNAAKSAAVGGLVTLTSDPKVTCLLTNPKTYPSGPPSNPSTIACANAVVGDSVSVTVTYGYKPFFPFLAGNTLNLDATVQMVIDS